MAPHPRSITLIATNLPGRNVSSALRNQRAKGKTFRMWPQQRIDNLLNYCIVILIDWFPGGRFTRRESWLGERRGFRVNELTWEESAPLTLPDTSICTPAAVLGESQRAKYPGCAEGATQTKSYQIRSRKERYPYMPSAH